jgi:hypothetical protein
VTQEERVFTARETEVAERRKSIELIEARKEAEREALRLTLAAAQAEKQASPPIAVRPCARRPKPKPTPTEDPVAGACACGPRSEAEGTRLMHEAQNVLSARGARCRRCG